MTDLATPTDTATSQSDPVETPAAVEAAAPAVATDAAAAADAEGTVLGGAQEAPPAEAPPAEAAPIVPEKYELAIEGVTLDAELVAEAEPIFRDLGLTNDQANALLPLAPKLMEKAQNAVIQQMVDAGAQQRKDWLGAFAADPTIGGAKRAETEHLAAKGLDALGFNAEHPFRKALNESGFGNHPDMIRAFRAIGEMTGEDGALVRSDASAKDNSPIWERIYSNSKSKA